MSASQGFDVALQCRAPATARSLRNVYLAETKEDARKDPNMLSNQLDTAEYQLRMKDIEMSKLKNKTEELEGFLGKQKEKIEVLLESKLKCQELEEGIQIQKMIFQEDKKERENVMRESEELKLKLEMYRGVELALKGQDGDINQFLSERGAFDRKTKDIATLVVVLNKKLAEVRMERNLFEVNLRETRGKCERHQRKVDDLEQKLSEAQTYIRSLENNNQTARRDSSQTASPTTPSPTLGVLAHSRARLRQTALTDWGVPAKRQKPSSSLLQAGLAGRSKCEQAGPAAQVKPTIIAKPRKSKLSSQIIKQNKIIDIDKFFGKFDSP